MALVVVVVVIVEVIIIIIIIVMQSESCSGCVLIDVEELNETLRNRANSPILLAYKYLLPDYQLKLSVKKHGDVDVLIAAVDCAYFTATKVSIIIVFVVFVSMMCVVEVEEGRVMYKLLMKVRNTQKQYARIELPSDCEIWSVVVKGQVRGGGCCFHLLHHSHRCCCFRLSNQQETKKQMH